MPRTHRYQTTVAWKGDRRQGTATYRSYERSHKTAAQGRPPLEGSSDHALHDGASQRCLIASSVNFPVRHEPEIVVTQDSRTAD